MPKARLADGVMSLLTQELGISVESPETDLFETGTLDSLSFVNLLLQLEAEYGVVIPLEKLEVSEFSTVNRIARYIDQETGDEAEFANSLLSRVG